MGACHHFPGGIIPEPDESHSGKLLKLPAAHLIFPFYLIMTKPLVGFVGAPGLLTRPFLLKQMVPMVHRLMASAPGLGWPSWPSCSTCRDSAATLFPWCLQKGLTHPGNSLSLIQLPALQCPLKPVQSSIRGGLQL